MDVVEVVFLDKVLEGLKGYGCGKHKQLEKMILNRQKVLGRGLRLKCENCGCVIIPVWKNPKVHSHSGEQEYLHDGLNLNCLCGCRCPEPKKSKAVSQ